MQSARIPARLFCWATGHKLRKLIKSTNTDSGVEATAHEPDASDRPTDRAKSSELSNAQRSLDLGRFTRRSLPRSCAHRKRFRLPLALWRTCQLPPYHRNPISSAHIHLTWWVTQWVIKIKYFQKGNRLERVIERLGVVKQVCG